MEDEATKHRDSRKERVVRLFGVSIVEGWRCDAAAAEEEEEVEEEEEEEEEGGEVMRKIKSMGNLVAADAAAAAAAAAEAEDGCLSDGGLVRSAKRRRAQGRKRAVPWTEDEHRTFLAGLEKLGKGDWRGISKNFVPSRTPTQVASHAQKYFLRQSNPNKKKRRSSLFDVGINDQTSPTTGNTVSPLSVVKAQEVAEKTNQIVHSAAASSTCNTMQFASQFEESFPAFPSIGGLTRARQYMDSNTYMQMSIFRTSMDQAILQSSFVSKLKIPHEAPPISRPNSTAFTPDYPKPRYASSPELHHLPTASSPSSVENRELELTIAPPQPRSLSKVSSRSSSGAITVI